MKLSKDSQGWLYKGSRTVYDRHEKRNLFVETYEDEFSVAGLDPHYFAVTSYISTYRLSCGGWAVWCNGIFKLRRIRNVYYYSWWTRIKKTLAFLALENASLNKWKHTGVVNQRHDYRCPKCVPSYQKIYIFKKFVTLLERSIMNVLANQLSNLLSIKTFDRPSLFFWFTTVQFLSMERVKEFRANMAKFLVEPLWKNTEMYISGE